MIYERIGIVTLVRMAPSELRIYAPSYEGLGRDESAPTSGSEALRATGAVFALDGPMFVRCDSGLSGTDAQRYAQSRCSRVEYLLYDREAQLLVPSRYPSRGATLLVANGQATVSDSPTLTPETSVAVQGYPEMIRRGVVVASTTNDTERVWRAGVGIDNGGNVVFVIGQGSMRDVSAAAAQAGVIELLYTDGGGSGRMQAEDGYVGSSENRRVGAWLLAQPARESSGPGLVEFFALCAIIGGGIWVAKS